MASKDKTVVFITGAKGGIGLELAKAYASEPNTVVIATVRNVEKDSQRLREEAKANVIHLDITEDEGCAKLEHELQGLGVEYVDVLINNSGIAKQDNLSSPDLLSIAQKTIEVNALGALRVTKALLPLVKKSHQKKIVNISSRLGSIGDNSSGNMYAYRASKAALNAISMNLAQDLSKEGITVLAVHPGNIRTDMNKQGDTEPDEAAKKIKQLVDKSKPEDGFKFWHRDGSILPW